MRFLFAVLLLSAIGYAQSSETPNASDFFHDRAQISAAALSLSLRVADLTQTMYHMNQSTWYEGKRYSGRETWLPTQNKGLISAALLGSGALTTYAQFRLYRSGRKRAAVLTQIVSSGISGVAIYRSFHSTYTAPGKK